jgi:hypothetical protein
LLADIRPLLDFDHFNFFEDFEAMAAGDKKDSIARFEDAAFEVLLLIGVEIDAEFTGFDEQNFLGIGDLAGNGVVDVRRDEFAGGVVHVSELLGELVRGKEVDTRIIEAVEDEQG